MSHKHTRYLEVLRRAARGLGELRRRFRPGDLLMLRLFLCSDLSLDLSLNKNVRLVWVCYLQFLCVSLFPTPDRSQVIKSPLDGKGDWIKTPTCVDPLKLRVVGLEGKPGAVLLGSSWESESRAKNQWVSGGFGTWRDKLVRRKLTTLLIQQWKIIQAKTYTRTLPQKTALDTYIPKPCPLVQLYTLGGQTGTGCKNQEFPCALKKKYSNS